MGVFIFIKRALIPNLVKTSSLIAMKVSNDKIRLPKIQTILGLVSVIKILLIIAWL